MKTFIFKKRSFILYILISLLTVSAFFFTLFISSADADSNSMVETEIFLPSSSLQLKTLDDPLGCFYWDENYAIINKNGTSLLIYNSEAGAYTELTQIFPLTSFNLKQVNVLSSKKLLVNNDGILRYFSLDDTSQISELKYNEVTISGNYFDACENYLVVSFNNRATCYTIENGVLTSSTEISTMVDADKPIKINNNGDIFYIGTDSFLYRSNSDASSTVKISESTIDNFICNNEFLYYLSSSKLFRIALTNNTENTSFEISLPETSLIYDLGYLTTPLGIAFKGDNLLFTDGDTIQEFSVTENALNFTGFAICKDKTAYNRISDTVKEVEKVGDSVAFLDNKKLTIINNGKNLTIENYLLGSKSPTSFSLGKEKVLYYYSNNSLELIDKENQISSFSLETVIQDICYQNGKFYVISRDINNKFIIDIIDESLGNIARLISEKSLDDINNVKICVDVFENIYIATGKSISICHSQNDYASTTITENVTGLIKLQTDLNGSLYALYSDNNIVKYFNNQSEEFNISVIGIDNGSNQITSFSMDYVDNSVYFIFNGEEYVFKTTTLGNTAIYDLDLVSINVCTAENANIETLKFYSTNNLTRAYEITFNETTFEYKGLFDSQNVQFVLINEINLQGTDYLLLAGNISQEFGEEKDIKVLINKFGTSQLDLVQETSLSKAYVATKVSMYYLPLITRNNTYCLSKEGEEISLQKKTEFSVLKLINFSGKEFYYATVVQDGVEHTGYIPVAFTTEVLSEDFAYPTFTYELVHNTKVYADEDLQVEIATLTEDTKIKLLETKDNVCKILYYDADVEKEGYITLNAIKTPSNNLIRNLLTIFMILICITVSSIYFMKKKSNKTE